MRLNLDRRSMITLSLMLIIGIGISLRITASRGWPLWQDEAETVINSLQVLEDGYPHSTFKNKPLFESAVHIPAPASEEKYAYLSTNYATSNLERNKGWLTYYLEAGFLKVFGLNTFSARLPFVLLAGASTFLIFVLGRRLFDVRTGLLAAGLHSFNHYAILNERQARYLSLEIFLVVACLLFFHAAIRNGKRASYIWSGIVLALLFYTHIVSALAMGVFFAAAHLYATHSLRTLLSPRFLLTVSVTLSLSLPWVIGVKLWTLTSSFSTILGPLTGGLIILLVGVTYFFAQLFIHDLRPKNILRMTSASYLILAAVLLVIIKPLLTPYESLAARLFVELNPIFALILAMLLLQWWVQPRHLATQLRIVGLVGLTLTSWYIFNDGLGKFQNNLYDSRWVLKSIDFLDQRQVDKATPIFVSYQQFPFMVYSDYNIDLLWPMRKSYIDTYPGTVYFIINRQATHPAMFYLRQAPTNEDLPYYDRIKTCTQHVIDEQTDILECPAPVSRPSN